ncbi:MAG: type I methionyl aminopeptidase [Mariprofundaceae bacterium]|nr:type I methionyl aminopeptidase [Mariprofundaceae bacterium]
MIKLKTPEDVDAMRPACRLAADTLLMIEPYIRPGITTNKINQLVHDYTLAHGGIPAPLNYQGFPKSVCTSVNHVVCHGIPSDKKILNGDIINIDVTTILNGWHGDTSRTFFVGDVKPFVKKLVNISQQCLELAIAKVKPGVTLGDIGHTIQRFAESHRYSVVREYCGHGIGREFHEDPQVLHYGKRGQGKALQEGMVFTIEPMINIGRPAVKKLRDQWTVVTRDKSLSAQFEHTIAVTATGTEILTLPSHQGAT